MFKSNLKRKKTLTRFLSKTTINGRKHKKNTKNQQTEIVQRPPHKSPTNEETHRQQNGRPATCMTIAKSARCGSATSGGNITVETAET